MNHSEVSSQLESEGVPITRQTVGCLLKRFHETASLEYRLSSGRPSKLTQEHMAFIEEKMRNNDELSSRGSKLTLFGVLLVNKYQ